MDKTGTRTLTRWVAVLLTGVSAALFASDTGGSGLRQTVMTPVQQRMQQIVSVEFKDTNIDDVLAILARQADVDILKSPKVQGRVTAVLKNIPLNEALVNILDVQGFGYVATDNMIRVVPKDEIFEVREKIESHVYRITYANVLEVERALRGFMSDKGSISANPGTGNIIVTDVESKIRAINSFIEEIDRITPQIMVEARIYDITSTESLDLGIEWQAGTSTSFGTVPTGATLGNQIGTIGNVLQDSVTNPHLTGALPARRATRPLRHCCVTAFSTATSISMRRCEPHRRTFAPNCWPTRASLCSTASRQKSRLSKKFPIRN